jgi:pimeloyl-ACP methyl ester carboxylesterase
MAMASPSTLPIRQSPAADPPGLPAELWRWDFTSRVDGVADWALLPPPLPGLSTWAVYIHGHGSTAAQLFTRADIRDIWLPALRRHGLNILSVHLRGNAWMGPAAVGDLHDLLDVLRQCHGARRFILVGGSMGGSSVLAYAARRPLDIAACLAICPATDIARFAGHCRGNADKRPVFRDIHAAIVASYGSEPEANRDLFAAHSACRQAHRLTMPIALAHAAGDETIPVTESRALMAAMGDQKRCRYIEEPAGNHDSPLRLMPSLLDWIIEQLDGSQR